MFRGTDSHRKFIRYTVVALCLAATALTSCVFNPPKVPPPPPPTPPTKPEELITLLETSYRQRDYNTFVKILSDAPDLDYSFLLNEPDPVTGETQWGRTEELRIHQRMFHPENVPAGDLPVPPQYWLASITINLTQMVEFQPRTDLGLDPTKWEATEARYGTHVLFDLQGPTDYEVNGEADFIVINDLSKAAGEERKFMLYRWTDRGGGTPKPAT